MLHNHPAAEAKMKSILALTTLAIWLASTDAQSARSGARARSGGGMVVVETVAQRLGALEDSLAETRELALRRERKSAGGGSGIASELWYDVRSGRGASGAPGACSGRS